MPQFIHSPTIEAAQREAVAAWRSRTPMFASAVIAAAIVAVACWFRIERLDSVPGLNGDEAWSGVQAINFLRGESVAWRTPTGNPLNLFFWGPQVVLHAIFKPSIALLRSVSVASGLLALALNFWLCRRTFDLPTAAISTLLLAVVPTLIAYSRFAWDASQTPLASVLVLYAALAARRSYAAIMASMVVAVWIHPTNVFLLPIVVACLFPSERILAAPQWLCGTVLAGVTVVFYFRALPELPQFLADFLRLFSGSTVYRFISGGVESDAIVVADLGTLALIAWASVGYFMRIESATDRRDLRLAIGIAASLGAFFAIAGPRGVMPHFERYAIWSIVPMTLAMSRGVAWWLQEGVRSRRVAVAAMLIAAALSLVNYQSKYFRVFLQSGGSSHLAFRTGALDPKQEALADLARNRPSDAPLTIVSANWWTFLPLQYLSAGIPGVNVVERLPSAASPNACCHIELAGSPEEQRLAKVFASRNTPHFRSTYSDRAGRPVVVVYWARESADDSLKNFARPQFDNSAN